jgi:hypothetical protein
MLMGKSIRCRVADAEVQLVVGTLLTVILTLALSSMVIYSLYTNAINPLSYVPVVVVAVWQIIQVLKAKRIIKELRS